VRPLARAAAAALATRACDTSSFSCPERNAVLTSCWRLGIGVGVGTMIGRERAGTSQPATSSSQQDPVRPPMFHWGFAHSTCVCVCESAFIYNQYRSPAGGIYLSSQRRL
jgi:hypothetical protein